MAKEINLEVNIPESGELITYNKDETFKYIKSQITKYEGLIYDDDSIKSAKNDRTKLNAFSKAINDIKIATKKKYLEPYTAFENDVKEMIAMLDVPLLSIDTQVKEYENRKKQEKRSRLEDMFQEVFGELAQDYSYTMIENPRWVLASTSEMSIRGEMASIYDEIVKDTAVIKGLNSINEVTLLDLYNSTRSLAQVMEFETRLNAKQELANQHVPTEVEKAQASNDKLTEAQFKEAQAQLKESQAQASQSKPIIQIESERTWLYLSFFVNEEEKELLRQLIIDNKIKVVNREGDVR